MSDKIPPQHPRPVSGDDCVRYLGPTGKDQHDWLTIYRPDVPAQFTHGAVLLYRDWRNQKAWADGRLKAYQSEMDAHHAERFEHSLTRARLTFWRVMSGAMAAMLLGVWANTYLFGGAA